MRHTYLPDSDDKSLSTICPISCTRYHEECDNESIQNIFSSYSARNVQLMAKIHNVFLVLHKYQATSGAFIETIGLLWTERVKKQHHNLSFNSKTTNSNIALLIIFKGSRENFVRPLLALSSSTCSFASFERVWKV